MSGAAGLSERNKKLFRLIQLKYESPFEFPRILDYLRDPEDSPIKALIASEELRFLLQPGPDGPLIVQECTSFSPLVRSSATSHQHQCSATPSSIRPGLGFD